MLVRKKVTVRRVGVAAVTASALILAGALVASPAMAASSVFGKMTPWGCTRMDVAGSTVANYGNTTRTTPICVGTAGVGIQLKRGGVTGQRVVSSGTFVTTHLNRPGIINGYHTGWGIAWNTWHLAGTLYS